VNFFDCGISDIFPRTFIYSHQNTKTVSNTCTVPRFDEKICFVKNLKNSQWKYHKKVSGFKFERAASIREASRQLRSFRYKLTDSTVGVAPNGFPERQGFSNQIGFDSIQFSIEKLQKPFDLI
jgi:hypothetical protein